MHQKTNTTCCNYCSAKLANNAWSLLDIYLHKSLQGYILLFPEGGAILVRPKQAFRLTQNAEFSADLTNCLMPSD